MRSIYPPRTDFLVCYDVNTTTVEGEARLRRVAKVCERFGQRVQYSVFECELTEALLEKMRNRLLETIDPAVDSVRIYALPGDRERRVEVHGVDRYVDFSGPIIT